ncbi:unnamed protein product, partial [Anisakis simplex]|uniref:1-phosphatidylinositol 3-phosphate 5-kinase (inferred by orthology to a human protein) n=1 Tax=Anisakis simplex TaxID=6269 RepID=A0A0M3JC39_ANISI
MSTDSASSTNLILGVDDCEPDWVRSIEMTTDSANKRNESFIKTDDANQSKVFPFFDNTECGDALNHSAITNAGKTTRPKFELSEELMPIDADIDKSFEERAQKLLLYLFERELLDPAQWWDVIWPVSRRVSEMIKIDSEGRKDHINILKYVHIKKLCVHEKPSAS